LIYKAPKVLASEVLSSVAFEEF